MALAATHMRFALDLKDEYRVRDVKKYIAGTIYPDSRYVTGLDRGLTHGEDILEPAFARDDFRKGWQVHELCDMVQYFVFLKTIPLLARHPFREWPEDRWLDFTAAKTVQDMGDAKKCDLAAYLPCLEYVANPNGEDIEGVRKFNRAVIIRYRGNDAISTASIEGFWDGLGLDRELGAKLRRRTEEFLADKDLTAIIGTVYDKMIAAHGKYLRERKIE
jgi:hypothetical protein